MDEPGTGISVELETTGMRTYTSGFDILNCVRPNIPQKELEKLDKIIKYLFESIRKLQATRGLNPREER